MAAGRRAARRSPRARWSLSVRGPLGPLLQRLAALPVADLHVDEPRLEDVVIDYYRAAGQEGSPVCTAP